METSQRPTIERVKRREERETPLSRVQTCGHGAGSSSPHDALSYRVGALLSRWESGEPDRRSIDAAGKIRDPTAARKRVDAIEQDGW